MTISISGTASGSKLRILQARPGSPDGVLNEVQNGSFSATVSKGTPVILSEVGDTTDYVAFKYASGVAVDIKMTGQTGKVVGRSKHDDTTQSNYCVRYVNGQGNQAEEWFLEDQLGESDFEF